MGIPTEKDLVPLSISLMSPQSWQNRDVSFLRMSTGGELPLQLGLAGQFVLANILCSCFAYQILQLCQNRWGRTRGERTVLLGWVGQFVQGGILCSCFNYLILQLCKDRWEGTGGVARPLEWEGRFVLASILCSCFTYLILQLCKNRWGRLGGERTVLLGWVGLFVLGGIFSVCFTYLILQLYLERNLPIQPCLQERASWRQSDLLADITSQWSKWHTHVFTGQWSKWHTHVYERACDREFQLYLDGRGRKELMARLPVLILGQSVLGGILCNCFTYVVLILGQSVLGILCSYFIYLILELYVDLWGPGGVLAALLGPEGQFIAAGILCSSFTYVVLQLYTYRWERAGGELTVLLGWVGQSVAGGILCSCFAYLILLLCRRTWRRSGGVGTLAVQEEWEAGGLVLAGIPCSSITCLILELCMDCRAKTLERKMETLASRATVIREQLRIKDEMHGERRKEEMKDWLTDFESLTFEVDDVAQKVVNCGIRRLMMRSRLERLVSKATRLHQYIFHESLTLDVEGDRVRRRSPPKREAIWRPGGGMRGLGPLARASLPFMAQPIVVSMRSTGDSCPSVSIEVEESEYEDDEEIVHNVSSNENFRRRITSWKQGRLLGSGSFGTVYEGFANNGFSFAVKEVLLSDPGGRGGQCVSQLEKEIRLLSQFEHENIVQYLGAYKDDKKLYIFLELLTRGSLSKLYQEHELGDSKVSTYTRQILLGLNYLHDRKVVHRDIKCANILVSENGSVKLADFGLAKATEFSDARTALAGTAFWMAPEVFNPQNKSYGLATDIWSLGCTVLEMFTRKHPYPNLEWVQALYRIGKGEPPEVPDSLPRDARDFILKCLQVNSGDRPTAVQLLDHPFVR